MDYCPPTSRAAVAAGFVPRSTPVDRDDADACQAVAYLDGAFVELATRATPGDPGSVTMLVPRPRTHASAPRKYDTVVKTGRVEVFMRPPTFGAAATA